MNLGWSKSEILIIKKTARKYHPGQSLPLTVEVPYTSSSVSSSPPFPQKILVFIEQNVTHEVLRASHISSLPTFSSIFLFLLLRRRL